MKGRPIPPIEKTEEMALCPKLYIEAVVQKYGINLRGSSEEVEVKYDPDLPVGKYGVTRKSDGGNVIWIGPTALQHGEADLANTIAHELSHARDYIRQKRFGEAHKPHGDHSSEDDGTVYGAGNALEKYIQGKR